MPNPSDACYASASQGAQDALAAWNTNRILVLVAIAGATRSPTPQGDAAPSPTPQADVTRTPAPPPASGTVQSVAPPALCTQAQFVVVPPAIRPGEATVIAITGFAPGSPATLTISGQTSRQTLNLPVVATAECAILIGGDATAHLAADTYQLRVSGLGFNGRPLEMTSGLTIR